MSIRPGQNQFKGKLSAAVRAKMKEHGTSKGSEKLSPELVEYFSGAK